MERKVTLSATWSGTVESYVNDSNTEIEVVVDFPEDADPEDTEWLSGDEIGDALLSELEESIYLNFENVTNIDIDEITFEVISVDDN